MLKLSNLNQRYKKVGGKLAILLALIAMQTFIWGWVGAVAAEVNEKRAQKQQISDLQQRIDQIRQVNETEKDFLNQLDVVTPPATSLFQAVERLERLAVEKGVTLTITDIQEKKDLVLNEELPTIPLQLDARASGSPAALLAYLHAIEHVQELTLVKALTITPDFIPPSPAPSGQPVVTPVPAYSLTMTIFFFLQPPPDADQTN